MQTCKSFRRECTNYFVKKSQAHRPAEALSQEKRTTNRWRFFRRTICNISLFTFPKKSYRNHASATHEKYFRVILKGLFHDRLDFSNYFNLQSTKVLFGSSISDGGTKTAWSDNIKIKIISPLALTCRLLSTTASDAWTLTATSETIRVGTDSLIADCFSSYGQELADKF